MNEVDRPQTRTLTELLRTLRVSDARQVRARRKLTAGKPAKSVAAIRAHERWLRENPRFYASSAHGWVKITRVECDILQAHGALA
jgi:hypothetical protein